MGRRYRGTGRQRRSNCPIACTLDLVGDRWSLLIVRDLLLGKARFDEFLASEEGICRRQYSRRAAGSKHYRAVDRQSKALYSQLVNGCLKLLSKNLVVL
jgi:DNA-binding HxlR family transcriptional regulator